MKVKPKSENIFWGMASKKWYSKQDGEIAILKAAANCSEG
jgi:hypothetical protein